jgi:hypothetical protein
MKLVTLSLSVALVAQAAHAPPDASPQAAQLAASPEAAAPTDGDPARRYAAGSTSVLGGATFTTAFLGASRAGTSFQAMALSGGVALRKVLRIGLTIEPRIGADAFLATSKSGLYALLAPRVGIGVGWALPLGRSVAVTPMLAYDALYLVGGVSENLAGFLHVVSLELPLTVFVGRRAFVEVFLDGGVVNALGEVSPMFTAGYRFGVVL